MTKVCITGHRPDSFLVSHYDEATIKRIAEDLICTLKREYGDELGFNLGGAIGADQWVGAACIAQDVRFSLYLPFLPQIQAKFWNGDQRQELDRQLRRASRILIADAEGGYNPARYHERDRMMVDDADFVVAFWVGKRRGGTFTTMKYALSKSKMVLNALDGLRPVFKQTLKDGWTPEHMKRDEQ